MTVDDRPLGECIRGGLVELGFRLDDVCLLRSLVLDDLDLLGRLLSDDLSGQLSLPFLHSLGTDTAEGLDDFLGLRIVVDSGGELLHGLDSDGVELCDVVFLQTCEVSERLDGHSFTL